MSANRTHQIFDFCHLLQVCVGSASMWVHWGQGWALWRRGSGVPVAGCNLLLPRPHAQGRACDHGCSVHRPGCTRCCISRSHGLLHAGSVGRRQAARRLCSGTCSGCMRARFTSLKLLMLGLLVALHSEARRCCQGPFRWASLLDPSLVLHLWKCTFSLSSERVVT